MIVLKLVRREGKIRFWASTADGRAYLVVYRGGRAIAYGPLSVTLVHLPEFLMLAYALLVFASLWLGVIDLPVTLMLVYGVIWLPVLILPRVILERKRNGVEIRLLEITHHLGDIYILKARLKGKDTTLYLKGKRSVFRARKVLSLTRASQLDDSSSSQ